MAFDGAENVKDGGEAAKVEHKPLVFDGVNVLSLTAIAGPTREVEAPPTNSDGPKEKPGVKDSDLVQNIDSGTVTYDKAGDIVAFQARGSSVVRHFTYHDPSAERSALMGIAGAKVYQDRNGTYFQYQKDQHNHDRAVPKFFTKALTAGAFADIRGSAESEALFDRATGINGEPVITRGAIKSGLTIRQTLDSVSDSDGHVWKRVFAGNAGDKSKGNGQGRVSGTGALHEFVVNARGKLVDSGKVVADSDLLPAEVSGSKHTLYDLDATTGATAESRINSHSVRQTTLGDCYFEGPLAANARSNPARLKEMIVDNHNGTYTVKFPLSDPTFKAKLPFAGRPTLDVTVAAPTAAEMYYFNNPLAMDQKSGYWSSVVEKAHRYLTGKIAEDDGGYGGDGLQYLSGVRKFTFIYKSNAHQTEADAPFYKGVLSSDPRQFQDAVENPDWKKELTGAIEEGKPVVARTGDTGSQSVKVEVDSGTYALSDKHVYSVVGLDKSRLVSGEPGEPYIVVRNPWGHVFQQQDNKVLPVDNGDDGYFEVSMDDFHKLFSGVFINETEAHPAPFTKSKH